MEYAQASIAKSAAMPQPQRPMEGISSAADRVSYITDRINGILARVQNRPEAAGDDRTAPLSISYLDNISRLRGNLDVLEKLTGELAELV